MDDETRARLEGLRDYVDLALNDRDREVKTARDSISRQLDGMNNLREQLNSQARTFLPRAEYDARHDDLVHRLEVISSTVAASGGKSQGISGFGMAVAYGILAVTAVAAVVISFVVH